MPDLVKRLTCPAEDAAGTIDLDSMTPADLVRWVASRLGLPYNEKGDKAFLGRGKVAPAPAKVASTTAPSVVAYSQRDSQVPGQAPRSCFSSSVAMMAKTVKPGCLGDGPNADDDYLRRVLDFGDTTEAEAQMKALAHLGVKARYSQALDWPDVDKLLKKGIPVPIGILHHGPVTAPSGGGHWICLTGLAGPDAYWVNDPWGELDLVAGVYVSTQGRGLRYSRKNLTPRWRVKGTGGWGVLATA